MARPKKPIRQRIFESLEKRSQARVKRFEDEAARVEELAKGFGFAEGHFRKLSTKGDKDTFVQDLGESAKREKLRAKEKRKKANRVKERHTTGSIGKFKQAVKGKAKK